MARRRPLAGLSPEEKATAIASLPPMKWEHGQEPHRIIEEEPKPAWAPCPKCGGRGFRTTGNGHRKCYDCDGTGFAVPVV